MSTTTDLIFLRTHSAHPAVVGVRAGTFALVSLFIGVWLTSLSRSVFDPIGFDQALYQYITDRVMLGQRLYTDVWDQNAPGIIGVHWLATVLVGRTPIALRVFDAVWQGATLAALVALAVRDDRRRSAGWLAAILYMLAYYGLGYVHTAQREGFAVLPLLLAIHALASARRPASSRKPAAAWHALAGALCFVVFAIKPPLGLCFGAIWLLAAADLIRLAMTGSASVSFLSGLAGAARNHDPKAGGSSIPAGRIGAVSERSLARTALFSLSLGFIISTIAAVGLLIHLGWWDGFWRVLSRKDVPGYIRGPQLIRESIPGLLAGAAAVTIILAASAGRTQSCAGATLRVGDLVRPLAAGVAVFGLLLTVQQWPEWQQAFFKTAGVLVPAAAAMLLSGWEQRSRIWKLAAVLALALLAAIMWQGHFALYQFPPLLALAAYLAAVEITERIGRISETGAAGRIWTMACVGLTIHLAVSTWARTMTLYSRSPYVLSGTTLSGHYTRVTRNKPAFPTYETTALAAARVRELTAESDPIVCLIDEPRLYYLAQRPPAYPLLRTQTCYSGLFAGLFEAIASRQPKVLVARLPADLRGRSDLTMAEPTLMDDLERCFGPPARILRDRYRLTDIINNDLCILQPRV